MCASDALRANHRIHFPILCIVPSLATEKAAIINQYAKRRSRAMHHARKTGFPNVQQVNAKRDSGV
jgi:hypothetical protein